MNQTVIGYNKDIKGGGVRMSSYETVNEVLVTLFREIMDIEDVNDIIKAVESKL